MEHAAVTLTISVAAVGLLAGCGPSARIDARNLSGDPLPVGRMAMLPPVLSSAVQDPAAAVAFVAQLNADLDEAGGEVVPDDLGLRPAPQPGTATQPPAQPPVAFARSPWVTMLPAERVQLVRSRDYATVCQPVVMSYGYYQAYVPPEVIDDDYDDEYLVPMDVDEGAEGGEGEAVEEGEGNLDDFGYEDESWPGWGEPDVYVLGHYQPQAQVAVAYHIYDAGTGQESYYIRASQASFDHRPARLEKGFRKPLTKAFRKAAGRRKPSKKRATASGS